jgi:transposase
MRFYTQQHPFYCGIALHARTMDVCILSQDGEVVLHRNMQAHPDALLKAIAPYRNARVVAVACIFTWDGLADLCPRENMPFVLGPALSMKAMHGGKAKNDRIDAPKIAVVLRGGMRPQAYVYPAAMRATRALLRRRLHLMRKRAALLAHVQKTNSQYHLPEIGKQIADKAPRDGVAERLPAPAVQKSIAVDLALLAYSDRLLPDLALSIVQTARQQDANPLSLLQTVPGMGKICSLVLLYAIHQIDRFPRGQDFVAYGRLVQCAKEAAGTRYGTSGTKSGHAYLTWAFAEAAVLCLRNHAQGQPSLARLEKTHAKGTALTILAHKWARAVYDRLRRGTVLERDTFLTGYGRRAGEPAASLDTEGISLTTVLGKTVTPCVIERAEGHRLSSLIPCGCLDTRSGFLSMVMVIHGGRGLPLSRTCSSLAAPSCAAILLHRTA